VAVWVSVKWDGVVEELGLKKVVICLECLSETVLLFAFEPEGRRKP
jgi:hypothetical protein